MAEQPTTRIEPGQRVRVRPVARSSSDLGRDAQRRDGEVKAVSDRTRMALVAFRADNAQWVAFDRIEVYS